jgi:ParB-like chromosome segregation protein Spo0J
VPGTESQRGEAAEGLGRAQIVSIESLRPPDSPRIDGADPEHVRRLAEADGELPPILVHRETRRIIDGAHRVQAARLRGEDTVLARFVDGSPEDVFVIGVQANITHGLPLSRADRQAAAIRILTTHPNWSDRAIAQASGLSARTLKALRERVGADGPRSAVRIGRDGRSRAVDLHDARRRALAVIEERPEASLREAARLAGVTTATVRGIRERLRAAGDGPATATTPPPELPPPPLAPPDLAPPPGPRPPQPAVSVPAGRPAHERRRLMDQLRRDPALGGEDGRRLLQWMAAWGDGLLGYKAAIAAIPPHCAYILARIARSCAEEFAQFADDIDEEASAEDPVRPSRRAL